MGRGPATEPLLVGGPPYSKTSLAPARRAPAGGPRSHCGARTPCASRYRFHCTCWPRVFGARALLPVQNSVGSSWEWDRFPQLLMKVRMDGAGLLVHQCQDWSMAGPAHCGLHPVGTRWPKPWRRAGAITPRWRARVPTGATDPARASSNPRGLHEVGLARPRRSIRAWSQGDDTTFTEVLRARVGRSLWGRLWGRSSSFSARRWRGAAQAPGRRVLPGRRRQPTRGSGPPRQGDRAARWCPSPI
jgi:hypothetical protein